jgi:hypothetical protein
LELLLDDNPRIVTWSPSVRILAYIFVLFLFAYGSGLGNDEDTAPVDADNSPPEHPSRAFEPYDDW